MFLETKHIKSFKMKICKVHAQRKEACKIQGFRIERCEV